MNKIEESVVSETEISSASAKKAGRSFIPESSSENFFVVIHPGHSSPLALERALVSASLRENSPHVHLFISPDVELMKKSDRIDGLGLSSVEFSQLTKMLENANISYDFEFCWTRDIEGSILKSAKSSQADMILYPYDGRAVRKHAWFTNAKWDLLRNSQCPVMLVKPESAAQRKVILAAVNFQSPFPEYTELNKGILERGSWLAQKYGADLHVINAYENMSDYPDVEKIKEESNLSAERLHILESTCLERAVSDVADVIAADLVLIGTRNSHDISSKYRRNTAEKVVAELKTDVLVLS